MVSFNCPRNTGSAESLLKSLLRTSIAASLCSVMITQPVLGENAAPPASPAKRHATAQTLPQPQLQGDDRILHALNRFTFGPRPSDLAAVKAAGLDAWFERQLNASSIDDAALDQRLLQFPAMQLSQRELMARYPGPAIIRIMSERGGLPLASDPTEKAIYADQIAFYKMAQERKKEKTPAVADPAMQASSVKPMAEATTDISGDGMLADGKGTAEKPLAAAELADNSVVQPPVHDESAYPAAKVNEILALAPDARAARIFSMRPEEVIAFRKSLTGRELQQLASGMSPLQKEQLASLQGSIRVVASEELQSRVLRDIYSERQLEAVMTDFWLNHFNVYIRKNQNEAYLLPSYERDVIRPNALGKFEDLLVATAKSPAMLMYLDNWQSVGPDSPAAKGPQRGPFAGALNANGKVPQQKRASGLNENYGRELMELHTLGVGGGYSQADVTNVSKVFTGWTIERPYRGGAFTFDERRHEPGTKTVLGQTIKENGQNEGLQVLHMLATSPATAQFISKKIAVRFVSDTPPQSLVDRMARSFLESDGDIKTVLRTMYRSPEFWSTQVYHAKVKTPIEFVVSAARASGVEVNNAQGLVQSLDRLGMPLYGMQTPNGYSWTQEGWVSTGALVSRMNFSLVMSGNRLPGVHTEWAQLLNEPAGVTATPASLDLSDGVDTQTLAKEKRLELLLLGDPVSDRTRTTVLSQSGDVTAADQAANQFSVGGPGGAKGTKNRLNRGDGFGAGNNPGGPDDRQAAVMAGLLLGSPEFQRR